MSRDERSRFLIAAGTESYRNLGDEWALTSVPLDLETIEALFATAAYGYRRVLTDLRLDPTSEHLLDGLQRWLTDDRRSAEDVAVVYYTGHGDVIEDTFYLITANTEHGNYDLTAVDVGRVVHLLRQGSPLRRLLVIIDACYSGQGAHQIVEAVVRNAKSLNFAVRGEGVWVVAAARPRQEARESRFAHAFAAAVRYWQANTGAAQRYIALETILDRVADELGAAQQPYWTVIGVGGLAPFFPNPNFRAALPVGVDLDTRRKVTRFQDELAAHWTAKARGSDLAGQGGWYFTGRRRALGGAAGFLASTQPGPSLLVLTGDPGSGKSAVLGRLVLHGEHAAIGTPIFALDDVVLPEIRFDAALLARGKTASDLLQELTDALNLPVGSDPIDVLATRSEPCGIVLDALDEAVDPYQVAADLITPLLDAGRDGPGGARLLVGTRRHLLGALPADRDLIDLDDDDYLNTEDITEYVRKILSGAGDPDSASPYRHDAELVAAVADEITRIAGHSFLIAQLAARTLATEQTALTAADVRASRSRWRSLDAAFERDLERYGDRAGAVGDLLGALAWAEGAGLPRELWPTVVNAVAAPGTAYTDGDVSWLLEHAGGYIIEAVEDERAVYRLYHQQFADHFRNMRERQDTHRRISDALLNHVSPSRTGRRNWAATAPYLGTHLSEHAAAGGRLDTLLEDLDFLLWAAPQRLLLALPSVHTREAWAVAAVYRRCADALGRQQPDVRASQLELTAHQLGQRDLAHRLSDQFPSRPWTTQWARWRATSDHRILRGYHGKVSAVAVGQVEGRAVAVTGSRDGTVRVWDLARGEPVGEVLRGDKGGVSAVAVEQVEGRPVAVTGGRDGVRVWDLAGGEPVGEPLHGHDGWVTAAAFGQVEGRAVAVTGGHDGVRVWDLARGQPLGEVLRGRYGPVNAVAVGQVEGRAVAVTAGHDGTVRIWDPMHRTPGGEFPRRHHDWVTALAVGQVKGRAVVVTGDNDGTVRIWDLARGESLGEPLRGHNRRVTAVAVGRVKGRAVAVTGSRDGTVRIWDLARRKPVGEPLQGHTGPVSAVAVGRVKGRAVVVTGGSDDTTVRVWDLARRTRIWGLVRKTPDGEVLRGHDGWVTAVALGQVEGRAVAVTGGHDGTVRIWDLVRRTPGGEVLRGHDGWVSAVAVGQVKGRAVAVTGGRDGTVGVWDLADGEPLGEPLQGHNGEVTAVAVGQVKGRAMVVTGGNDRTVRLWDLARRKPVGEPLQGHTGWVTAVAVGQVEGRAVVISGSDDTTVRVWDLARRTRIWGLVRKTPDGEVLRGHDGWVTAVALGQVEGRAVAVTGGHDGTVRIWDLVRRTPGGEVLRGHDGWVSAVAVGQVKGRAVAVTGGDDGTVRLWDLARGESLGEPLRGHDRRVTAVALGQIEGRAVAVTGSYDRTLQVWRLAGKPASDTSPLDVGSAANSIWADTDGTVVLGTGGGVITLRLQH